MEGYIVYIFGIYVYLASVSLLSSRSILMKLLREDHCITRSGRAWRRFGPTEKSQSTSSLCSVLEILYMYTYIHIYYIYIYT